MMQDCSILLKKSSMHLKLLLSLLFLYSIKTFGQASQDSNLLQEIIVPLGGNTFTQTPRTNGSKIGEQGIVNWTDKSTAFKTYVRFSNAGSVKVWLTAKGTTGRSRIKISTGNVANEVVIEGIKEKDYYAGEWLIKDSGYTSFNLTGITKSGNQFADVVNMKITGTAAGERAAYVKDNNGNFFYWGRRGPSVHLNYRMPEHTNAEWFYNEITVPVGNDVMGSYFMANGFAEGYFGIQVNSPVERRILFSVWSPFSTDDPKSIFCSFHTPIVTF
jgi:hypothetical protein